MSIYHNQNQPYTYLVGWSKLDRWYYGVRSANKCAPVDDLWKVYYTSSKYVKELRREHGDPDVIVVRRMFGNPTQAYEWEKKVLRRLGVLCTKRWLNKNVAGCIAHTNEIHAAIRQSLMGRKVSRKTRTKIANSLSKQWDVISPDGNRFVVSNLSQFCRDRDISDSNLRQHGHSKGWYARRFCVSTWETSTKEERNKTKALNRASRWCVTDPHGVRFDVTNLNEFCRLHDIHMSTVTRGYGGYTAVKLGKEDPHSPINPHMV